LEHVKIAFISSGDGAIALTLMLLEHVKIAFISCGDGNSVNVNVIGTC